MAARVPTELRRWRKGWRRYGDHIDVADAFLARVGAKPGDALHRLIVQIISIVPLSHSEAVSRMKKYRKFGYQEDFDAVVASFMWSALRPIMLKPIYDDVFEDAFQESMASMIEFLRGMDIEPEENWRMLRAYPIMNARTRELAKLSSALKVDKSRESKKVLQALDRKGRVISSLYDSISWIILEDALEEADHPYLLEMKHKTLTDDFSEAASNSASCDSTDHIDRRIDLERLIKWAEENLSEKELAVLHGRILDPEELCFNKIGEKYHLTGERMRQIYRDALITLRHAWETDLGSQCTPKKHKEPSATCSSLSRELKHTHLNKNSIRKDQILIKEDIKGDLPSGVIDAAHDALSDWLGKFLQSETIVDLISMEAPNWAVNLLGKDETKEKIAKIIETTMRSGLPQLGGDFYSESSSGWPKGATHRIQINNLIAYGHYNVEENRMALLPGSVIREGNISPDLGPGYRHAYAATRIGVRNSKTDNGDILLEESVCASSPSAAAFIVFGFNMSTSKWQSKSGFDLQKVGRGKKFPNGHLVDLDVSVEETDAWFRSFEKTIEPRKDENKHPEGKLGRFEQKVVESMVDSHAVVNGATDQDFSKNLPKAAGSYLKS